MRAGGVPRSTVYRRLEAAGGGGARGMPLGGGLPAVRPDRRGVHQPPFLPQPAYGGLLARPRALSQSQAGAAPDAGNELGGHGAGTDDEQAAPKAQGLSIPAARGGGHAAEPGAEYGSDVHPTGARLCLLGGDHRLVLAPGAGLAYQQQHGCVILRGLPGRRAAPPRQA